METLKFNLITETDSGFRNRSKIIKKEELENNSNVGISSINTSNEELCFLKVNKDAFKDVRRVQQKEYDILIVSNKWFEEEVNKRTTKINGKEVKRMQVCPYKIDGKTLRFIEGKETIAINEIKGKENLRINDEQREYVDTLIEGKNIYWYSGEWFCEKEGVFNRLQDEELKNMIAEEVIKYDRSTEEKEVIGKLKQRLRVMGRFIIEGEETEIDNNNLYFPNGYYDLKQDEFIENDKDAKKFKPFMFPDNYIKEEDIKQESKDIVEKLLTNMTTDRWIKSNGEVKPFNPNETKDNRELLNKMIAMCCTTFTSKAIFFLYGTSGGNWKTTFIQLLSSVVGNKWVGRYNTNEKIQEKANQDIVNRKFSNEDDDNKRQDLGNVSGMKTASSVGNPSMKVRNLYSDAVTFRNRCTLTFNVNSLPKGLAEDNGIYLRTRIIEINSNQKMEDIALTKEDFKLLSEDVGVRQYIHHIVIKNIKEIIKNNFEIENSKNSLKVLEEYANSSNNVSEFFGLIEKGFLGAMKEKEGEVSEFVVSIDTIFKWFERWYKQENPERTLPNTKNNFINKFKELLIRALSNKYYIKMGREKIHDFDAREKEINTFGENKSVFLIKNSLIDSEEIGEEGIVKSYLSIETTNEANGYKEEKKISFITIKDGKQWINLKK